LGVFGAAPDLVADRPGQLLIGDKNYYGREFDRPARRCVRLLRPAREGETHRPGARRCSSPCAKPSSRSTRPSRVSYTWSADTPQAGVLARVLRRILALTARDLAQRPHRANLSGASLVAFDH